PRPTQGRAPGPASGSDHSAFEFVGCSRLHEQYFQQHQD
ncbi:unnamed protein product, partial [Ectocarpus sp. 12 AP-2014]